MSSLKDRLKRLAGSVSGGAVRGEESKPEAKEDVCDDGGAEAGGPGSGFGFESLGPEWDAQDARLVSNEGGSFIMRRCVYPWEHRHGRCRLADLVECAGELAAFHGGGTVKYDELLFFDTETTGLGHGAGNVPFMVGIGFWEAECFIVEQLFIRNPAEEVAMLTYLRRVLERYPYLVSYNGRAFDWPMLKNRYVLNRMKDGIPEPLQLDFLYPSRSLWRNTLPSCRLGKVEEGRLGFFREDDVPGSMAPELYFLYLAEKDPRSMKPVFLHNELDVLSLAGLAVHFAQAMGGSTDLSDVEPEERFRLGLWLDKLGKREMSLQVLEPLATVSAGAAPKVDARTDAKGYVGVREVAHPAAEVAMRAESPVSLAPERPYWLPLAAHYKQIGEWEKAVALWHTSVAAGREGISPAGPSLEPYIELSMHYEHRMKDPFTALLYAEEALQWAERRQSAFRSVLNRQSRDRMPASLGGGRHSREAGSSKQDGEGGPYAAELAKRIERLRRRLERQGSSRKPPGGGKRRSGGAAAAAAADPVGGVDAPLEGQPAQSSSAAEKSFATRRRASGETSPDLFTLL